MSNQIKFQTSSYSDFFNILQVRVNAYFRRNHIRKDGGNQLVYKSVLLLTIFLAPFLAILTIQPSASIALSLLIIMGVGKAGVGMSVMHDALHGSLSRNKLINIIFGHSIYLLGGNATNWKIQHNVLHHTYPNVYKVDEDVSTKGFIVRLSPESRLRSIHRYQWLYVVPLYGLMTMSFMAKDFKQLWRYIKNGEIKRQGLNPKTELARLIAAKASYLTVAILVPLLVTAYSFMQIIAGFLIIHFIAGLILSLVFQLAHVVEDVEHPERNLTGDISTSWAIHQLTTTSNFCPYNKWIHWYTGGLNFQVEHHLFPHISHIHYPKIAPIVKKTAEEFGVPYHWKPDLKSALSSHIRTLRELGTARKLELA